jgi:hypothetical protein
MRVFSIIAMVGCLTASAAASAQTPYDGTRNVTTQTRTGSCEPTVHYALTVVDGKVSGPENVSDTVSRSGNVWVSIGAAYTQTNSRLNLVMLRASYLLMKGCRLAPGLPMASSTVCEVGMTLKNLEAYLN